MALARRLVDPEETENSVVTSWDSPRPEREPGLTTIFRTLQVEFEFYPAIEVSDPDALFRQEKAAFEAMLPELLQQHPGKYVAVHNGRPEVIADTESEAVRHFFQQFGDTHVYIGYVGDAEPATYQVSPFGF